MVHILSRVLLLCVNQQRKPTLAPHDCQECSDKNWWWIYGLEMSYVQAITVPGSIALVCGFQYFCHGSVIMTIMAWTNWLGVGGSTAGNGRNESRNMLGGIPTGCHKIWLIVAVVRLCILNCWPVENYIIACGACVMHHSHPSCLDLSANHMERPHVGQCSACFLPHFTRMSPDRFHWKI